MMVCITIQAQQYHPLVKAGKEWSTAFVVSIPPYAQHTEYQKFDGDTVVGGKTYMKIMTMQDTLSANWILWALIREDASHRVYQYNEWVGLEFLLYDFGAAIGDTIVVNQGVHLVLDSMVTTTLVTGEIRNRYVWKNVEYAPTWIQWESWTEGVGSELGVLMPGSQAFVGGYSYMLCMHENDTLKYVRQGNASCIVLLGVDTEKNLARLRIRQVTHDGQFEINISPLPVYSVTVEVVNLQGAVAFSAPFNLLREQSVDLSMLPDGLYILILHSNQLNLATKFFKR